MRPIIQIEQLERRALLTAALTQIDLTFGNLGVVYTQAEEIRDVAMQPDGKVLATGTDWQAGRWDGDFAVARYLPSGALDTTFGDGGIACVNFFNQFDTPESIVLLADGKILVAGNVDTTNGGGQQVGIARFNANGTVDTTFGGGGTGTYSVNLPRIGYGSSVTQMAVTPDGKILLTGAFGTLRLNVDGTADTTFAQAGVLNVAGDAIVAQADGKFVTVQFGCILKRFNADGSLDTTFGTGGSVTVPTLPAPPDAPFQPHYGSDRNYALLQGDGKILVSTPCSDGKRTYFTIFRFNTDGTLDNTFSSDGRSDLSYGGSSVGMSLALAPDGKIVQSGMIDQNMAALRYNADGSLDTTFGYNGVGGVNLGGANGPDGYFGYANGCGVDASGNVYLGGMDPERGCFAVLKFAANPTYTVSNNGGILVRGTEGNDVIIVRRSFDDLRIERNGVIQSIRMPLGVLTVVEALGGDDIVVIENGVGPAQVYGGDGNDRLVGGDYNDSLNGNAGKDRIDAGAGDDRVAGNGGNDQLTGGDGRDRLYGDAGNDAAIGGNGADRLWGGIGNDLLSGNGGSDALYGETGANTLSGGSGTDRFYNAATSDILLTGGDPTIKLIDENTGLITLLEGLL